LILSELPYQRSLEKRNVPREGFRLSPKSRRMIEVD